MSTSTVREKTHLLVGGAPCARRLGCAAAAEQRRCQARLLLRDSWRCWLCSPSCALPACHAWTGNTTLGGSFGKDMSPLLPATSLRSEKLCHCLKLPTGFTAYKRHATREYMAFHVT